MRIAFANWSHRRAGGAESYVEFAAAALHARGHAVALWSERDQPVDRQPMPLPEATATWCAEAAGVKASLAELRRWCPSVLFVHGLVDPHIERELQDAAPSVLLAHSYYGTCISGGKTHRFPVVMPCDRIFGPGCLAHFYPRRCGGLSPVTMARDYRRQRDRLDAVRRYGAVLTLSAHMRTEYVRHGLDPLRVHALPPYQPAQPFVERPRRGDGPIRLLFFGRLDRLKGCQILIEALPEVRGSLDRPLQATIAGDGPDRVQCERLSKSVNPDGTIDIRFTGWLDASARTQLFAETDVLVMPSIWPEPYGLSGLEALSAGIPVAAFRSGAVPEWLREGETGALAPVPPTASGLAAAIVRSVRLGLREPLDPRSISLRQRRHLDVLESCLEEAGAARRAAS